MRQLILIIFISTVLSTGFSTLILKTWPNESKNKRYYYKKYYKNNYYKDKKSNDQNDKKSTLEEKSQKFKIDSSNFEKKAKEAGCTEEMKIARLCS